MNLSKIKLLRFDFFFFTEDLTFSSILQAPAGVKDAAYLYPCKGDPIYQSYCRPLTTESKRRIWDDLYSLLKVKHFCQISESSRPFYRCLKDVKISFQLILSGAFIDFQQNISVSILSVISAPFRFYFLVAFYEDIVVDEKVRHSIFRACC